MNYSIFFTEISFSSETSILLQIIRIIHMTIWLIQNLTEKGGQSVKSVSKVVYTMRLQQIKKNCLDRDPLGTFSPPFFKGKEGMRGPTRFPDNSLQKEKEYIYDINKYDSLSLAGWKRYHFSC